MILILHHNVAASWTVSYRNFLPNDFQFHGEFDPKKYSNDCNKLLIVIPIHEYDDRQVVDQLLLARKQNPIDVVVDSFPSMIKVLFVRQKFRHQKYDDQKDRIHQPAVNTMTMMMEMMKTMTILVMNLKIKNLAILKMMKNNQKMIRMRAMNVNQ